MSGPSGIRDMPKDFTPPVTATHDAETGNILFVCKQDGFELGFVHTRLSQSRGDDLNIMWRALRSSMWQAMEMHRLGGTFP